MPLLSRYESYGNAIAARAVDTSTNAPSILAINIVLCAISVIAVSLRMYVRTFMLKVTGSDDYLLVAATILGIGCMVCFIGETHNGIGRHQVDISGESRTKIAHWRFFHNVMVTVGISLVKLSMARFLLRLVTGKAYKYFLYFMIVFTSIFTCTSAGTIIFSCIPINASWDTSVVDPTCFSADTFTVIGMTNSIINIITDVIFASIPIPLVWDLHVTKRTKLSLLGILSLGYFACAASIVKTVLQAHTFADLDASRNASYYIWNSIELYAGILAAALPTLRPLLRRFLESTQELRTRATGSSAARMGTRHKYYAQSEGIGMKSLHTHNGQTSREYDVKITTVSGRQSDDDYESTMKSRGDKNDSSEDILPLQNNSPHAVLYPAGIMKTTNVTVTSVR